MKIQRRIAAAVTFHPAGRARGNLPGRRIAPYLWPAWLHSPIASPWVRRHWLFLLCLSLAVLGVGDGRFARASASIDITGQWNGLAFSPVAICDASIIQIIDQFVIDGSCTAQGMTASGHLSGTINTDSGSLTGTGSAFPACTSITIAGTASMDGNSMSGTYDCQGPFGPFSGPFTGSRQLPPCSVPNLPALATDALPFEDAAQIQQCPPSVPPLTSLFFPSVEQVLDQTVASLQASPLGPLQRNSGYRPISYQRHFRELRDSAIAVNNVVADDPIQETACADLIATLRTELARHCLKTSPGFPVPIARVNAPTQSAHTQLPARALDLDTTRPLPGLIQPCGSSDPIHYTLPGTPCKQSVQGTAYSPVALLLVDPLGRRVGFDLSTASEINEIGASAYYSGLSEPQIVTVDETIPGEYTLVATGTGTGPYQLTLERNDEDAVALAEHMLTGDITPGAVVELKTQVPMSLGVDIIPNDAANVITLPLAGEIQVAILSETGLQPSDIDENSITFGRTGTEASALNCTAGNDLNSDGVNDLVCSFDLSATDFMLGDVQGVVRGQLSNGVTIVGVDIVELILVSPTPTVTPLPPSTVTATRTVQTPPEPTPCLGDVDGNGRIEPRDIVLVAHALFSRPGHARWNPRADINQNDIVDPVDLLIVLASFQDRTCRYPAAPRVGAQGTG